MRHYCEKRAVTLVFSALILALASFLATPLAAQQPGRTTDTSLAERNRMREIRRNDQIQTNMMIDALKADSRRPVEDDRQRLAYLQIKDDFEHIQTVNNQMMLKTLVNDVFDYKSISEASAEIRKRALRLKTDLPLPELEKDEQKEQPFESSTEGDRAQMKSALQALDDLVMRFVTNPVFQQPEIVDVQLSSIAQRDLKAIIKLSGKIKKQADKLMKTPRPL